MKDTYNIKNIERQLEYLATSFCLKYFNGTPYTWLRGIGTEIRIGESVYVFNTPLMCEYLYKEATIEEINGHILEAGGYGVGRGMNFDTYRKKKYMEENPIELSRIFKSKKNEKTSKQNK